MSQPTSSAGQRSISGARVRVRELAAPVAVVALVLLAVTALTGTAAALNRATHGVAATPSTTEPHWLCPEGACEAIAAPRPDRVGSGFAAPGSSRLYEGGGELGGYDPADLQSAYNIPSGTEGTQTVAVVDAFGYSNAEADLAAYRSRYGLPACTKANGCFKKVNETGEEANYPPDSAGWEGESALDLDMVSAACPECHIILVEASAELPPQIPAAVNEAVALGANEISNSYGLPELYEPWCGTNRCEPYNSAYQHPGVEIFASAGDQGYMDTYWKAKYGLASQTNFPASTPGVVAVGGTALYHKEGGARGWKETVWDEIGRQIGTGAGCTVAQTKPPWQTDTGCAHRTVSDVSAVAAVETGVSVRINGDWEIYGGTSVSSPLVAGIVAHASAAVRDEGAGWFYRHPNALHDVTTGFAGFEANECSPNLYLCNGEIGYDGPTGLGTPNGGGVSGLIPQSVSFTSSAPSNPTVGSVYPVAATASSGLTVSFSVDPSSTVGACSVSGATVSFPGPGSCVIDADQPGNAEYEPAPQQHQTIMVRASRAATVTSLSLSQASASYGGEQAVTANVAITSAGGGVIASGSITVRAGTAALCTATITDGAGSCSLASMAVTPGTHRLRAFYAATTHFWASISTAAAFTVTKDPTATTLSLSSPSAVWGSEENESFTVAVTVDGSLTPTGSVKVMTGSTTLCTATLRGGIGKCSLTARKLPKVLATYSVEAAYAGSTTVAASTSSSSSLEVQP